MKCLLSSAVVAAAIGVAHVGDPQEVIISGHSSTDLVDDDAVAGRRHGRGRCGDVVCAAAG